VVNAVFHPEAQGEYQAAFVWYQARSPQAAVRFEAEVERVIQSIESNPGGFPKYDDLHCYALLRRFPYSIVYQHWADQIYVIGVVHGSRLPGYWKNRT
jgi:toxin ParE1/3/4